MVGCKRTQCTWKLGFGGACIGVVLSAWSAIIVGGGAEAWSFISKRGFALHPIQGAFLNRPGKLHGHIDTKNICIYIYTYITTYPTLLYSTLSYHTMTIPCPYTMTIQYRTYHTISNSTYNYIQLYTCNYMQLHTITYN